MTAVRDASHAELAATELAATELAATELAATELAGPAPVCSTEALAALTPRQRAELLGALLRMAARPVVPRNLWARRLVVVLTVVVSATVLSGWIAYLGDTLPTSEATDGWRLAWVGFDVAELIAYVVTGWAAWRYRHALIPAMFVSATLLLCDAWFDLTLSWGTGDWWESLASAVFLEVPMAIFLIILGRRLNQSTLAAARASLGLGARRLRRRSLLDPAALFEAPTVR